ncbi:MAG: response regulator [Spirochaetales bacterium]|nr:response regulator [Spirochaetales bacterium]
MNTKRVLVVDNEKNVLDTFRLLLEDLGFEPVLIDNYEDAVLALEKSQENRNTFRAAIIDYQLNNGHTGLEIFERIMETDKNLARRCIIVTARHHTDALALFSHTKIKPGLFLYKDYDDNKKIEDFLCRP